LINNDEQENFVNFVFMGSREIDIEKLTKYWIETSDDDFETMMAMFETKRFT